MYGSNAALKFILSHLNSITVTMTYFLNHRSNVKLIFPSNDGVLAAIVVLIIRISKSQFLISAQRQANLIEVLLYHSDKYFGYTQGEHFCLTARRWPRRRPAGPTSRVCAEVAVGESRSYYSVCVLLVIKRKLVNKPLIFCIPIPIILIIHLFMK
jgi:hypothetical protein